MARLVLGVAGAALGSAIPGVGASWGWTIGSFLGGALFPEKLPTIQQQGPRLNDLSVQSSAYGGMVPWVRGTVRLSGNVIWSEPLTEVATTTETEQGGKGGGPSQTTVSTTYAYYATFALALCEGEIVGIRRLWLNGELVFDQGATAALGDVVIANEQWAGKFRVYPGSETQIVDSAIEAHEGVGVSSAYRGTAYIVFDALNVTNTRTLPLVEAEVVKSGSFGQLVTYYDQDMSSDSGAELQECASILLTQHQEVWAIDAGHNPPFGPNRFAIFDLATETTTFLDFPGAYFNTNTTEVPRLTYLEDRDKLLVGCRDGSGNQSVLVFDCGTRTYIGSYAEELGWGLGARLLGVDALRNRVLIVEEGAGHRLVTIDAQSAMPIGVYLGYATGVNVHSYPDEDGNFWAINRPNIYKFNTLGIVEQIPIDADDCDSSPARWDEIAHDPSRNALYYWSLNSQYLKKLDMATEAMSRVNSSPYTASPSPGSFPIKYEPSTDTIYALKGGSGGGYAAWEIDPTNGALTQYSISDPGGIIFLGSFAYAVGVIWSPSYNWGGSGESGLGELRFNALTAASPTLASVRGDLYSEVGITSADIDSTALTAITVRGVAVTRIGAARIVEESLMQRYNYDVVQSDAKLKGVLRGGAVAHALDSSELGVS